MFYQARVAHLGDEVGLQERDNVPLEVTHPAVISVAGNTSDCRPSVGRPRLMGFTKSCPGISIMNLAGLPRNNDLFPKLIRLVGQALLSKQKNPRLAKLQGVSYGGLQTDCRSPE